jgi:hypothetical protein
MELSSIVKGHPDNQTKLLYATLLGAIGASLTPNPGDVIYWNYHKKIRDKWVKGEITSKQYWQQQATAQYLASSTYWVTLLGIAYLIPGEYKKKLGIVLALAALGSVGAMLYKYYKVDENDNVAELNAIKQKLYESANDDDLQRAKNLI